MTYPSNITNDITRWDVLRHARDLDRETYVERRNWELYFQDVEIYGAEGGEALS